MAKICSICSAKNKDKDAFCKECGASLADAVEIADSSKGKRIKQEQDPVARKVLAIVLIAACLLCLYATFRYLSGAYSFKLVTTLNLENGLEINSPEDIWNYLSYFQENRTYYQNSWYDIISIVQHIKDYGNMTRISDFDIFVILSQFCNTVSYLVLTILTAIAALLVLLKTKAARVFVWIDAIAGLLVTIFGSAIGYFLIVDDFPCWSGYAVTTTKMHLLPQQTIWALIPLFVLMPILALMLHVKNPKKLPE